MNEEIKRALEAIGARRDEESYFAACSTLVANRDKLPYRVHVQLPGGLSSNSDPRWDAVRAGSDERCSCGNERVICPLNPRTEFEAASGDAVIVKEGRENAIYLKPRGGDRASAYVMLWVDANGGDRMLAFMADPFGPLLLSVDLFSTRGYSLAKLAELLSKRTEPTIMQNGKEKTPVFAISKADPAGNVTIVLDKDVELLTEEEIKSENAHKH